LANFVRILEWAGLSVDEGNLIIFFALLTSTLLQGPSKSGEYGPYVQVKLIASPSYTLTESKSERTHLYKAYANELIKVSAMLWCEQLF